MKKLVFFVLGVLALIPTGVLAVTPMNNIQLKPVVIPAPTLVIPPKSFTCSIEAKNKAVGLTNVITYKVYYTSNYTKVNANYVVDVTPVSNGGIVALLDGARGTTSFVSGKGYVSIRGNTENTLTYAIKDRGQVEVHASVDGVKCKPKVLNTIASAASIGLGSTTTTIPSMKPNLQVTTTIQLPIVPPAPAYTCSMLIEAAAKDEDTILIGGAIGFDHIKAGLYPFTVRGYRNDDPNTVTKFTGTYDAKVDTDNGRVFSSDGSAFFFTYDSKSKTDAYVITATLGNVDCSDVLLPSHMQQEGQTNDGAVAGEESGESADVAEGTTTVDNGVVAVGPSSEDRQVGIELDLLVKTGNPEAQAVAASTTEKEVMENASANDMRDSPWTSKDYTIAGLLGAILVALLGYGIMKYRGMI